MSSQKRAKVTADNTTVGSSLAAVVGEDKQNLSRGCWAAGKPAAEPRTVLVPLLGDDVAQRRATERSTGT